MRLRLATPADATAMTAIYNQGIEDRMATFETRLRTPQEIEQWFDGVHPIVVLEADQGQVIAFASTSIYRPRPCYAGIAEFSVYVERPWRGQGAGRLTLEGLLRETEKAARASGMEISLVEARSGKDLDGAFALIAKIRPEALLILPASLMTRYASQIAELALNRRMPTISYFREFPEVGGLMAYGPSLDYSAQRAAVYVDQILKGAKPSDLPVQQPTKFELVINLRTAKAFSLTVPKRLSAIADELIE